MRRTLLLALLAGALLSACGGSEAEPEAGPEAPEPATSEETTTEEATEAETTTEAAPPPTTTRAEKKLEAPPGVPGFVAGYRGWTKLTEEPLPPRESDPHNGTKQVYASKPVAASGRFPNGTIVVKEATRPGADFIGLIAIMRKRSGADPEHNDWVFVEYTREAPDARFGFQAEGAVCWSCHVGAQDSDYVFTAGG